MHNAHTQQFHPSHLRQIQPTNFDICNRAEKIQFHTYESISHALGMIIASCVKFFCRSKSVEILFRKTNETHNWVPYINCQPCLQHANTAYRELYEVCDGTVYL